MYRPNFCAECGERVLSERWRAWTSRRFCPACDRRLGARASWARPLAAFCLAACGGFAAGRFVRPAPPPLLIERRELPLPALLARPAQTARAGETQPATQTPDSATPSALAQYGADGTQSERPTDPNEVVSVCGARTKKGTPCSRRVRGAGRCWQHRGKPAMLPASKLVVRD